MATKRSTKEIADELDTLATTLNGPRARRLAHISAELRGEKLEPTAQEVRDAERVSARAEQAQRDLDAAKAAEKAVNG